jgi:hypothetical protein
VNIATSAGATTGTFTLTVTGSGESVADATASLSLEVTAAPSGESVTLTFCEASGVPAWLAIQDGNGPWVPVQPEGTVFGGGPQLQGTATYNFQITSNRGGIAQVFLNNGMARLELFYAAADELGGQGDDHCVGTGVTKTVTGSVTGMGATDWASIGLGDAATTVVSGGGAGPYPFTLMEVDDGPHDLLAGLAALTAAGGGFSLDLIKVIIRRSQNPADNAVLPLLDFGSAEAFDPVMRNLTLNNLGTDATVAWMAYTTGSTSTSTFFNDFQAVAGNTRTYPGIPTAKQETGDLHSLTLIAADPNATTLDRQRTANLFFREATDRTVNFGPDLAMPTITVPDATPYAKPRTQYPLQAEYGDYWYVTFDQTGGRQNSAGLGATPGYLNGGDFDFTIPEFSGLTGWDDAWGLEAGLDTTWGMFGVGWNTPGGIPGGVFHRGPAILGPRGVLEDGAVFLSAIRWGDLTW